MPEVGIEKVALGIDIRGGKLFNDLLSCVSEVQNENHTISILFLDASDETILKRFKESRRNHPLARGERIISGIMRERELFSDVKRRADYIIDTSHILTRQLKEKINDIFLENKTFESLMVTVLSFGFKYGIPSDSDLVFDVRFIPNPFYIAELKPLTGNDIKVRDYVMEWEESREFIKKLEDMISFLLPNYIKEGKNQLVISIGCTGGKHRSVTLANEIYERLKKNDGGYGLKIEHRDIEKDRASNILGNKKV